MSCSLGYDVRSPRTGRSCRGGRSGADDSPGPMTLDGVVNPANLDRVLDTLRRRNGQAPGADGVRYPDLSTGEWFQLLRDLRDDVLAGRYRPQPVRALGIPKASGGTRTLSLPTVADRILSKAVANAVEPSAERVFLPCSYGFRPQLDRLDLLADGKLHCEAGGQWVLTADDVRSAFDAVPVTSAAVVLRRLGVDPGLAGLAEIILRGHTCLEVGIAQGDPLSPSALNLLLHHALDTPMSAVRGGRHPAPTYARYADNVLVATGTAAEGREHLDRVRALLDEIGMDLKGDPGVPRDLRHGDRLTLLGASLTYTQGRLRFDVPHKAWADLQTGLVAAHDKPNPRQTAYTTVQGWVRGHAPAFDTRTDEEFRNRLLNLLRATGHRGAITRTDLARHTDAARRSWDDRLAHRSRLRDG